ncbi:flavin reductase family protein [Celeribacter halophilus]|uniref:flavin reductase family protein n=1 Tax=Celeribacter halophilus TaxID=576117 RepID=UPI0026E22A0F|nr:flavin reductase family protein [Celeribacter halophilus]MDO6724931.1 flavin reductase family protein [Celeribacter halophilus]
MTMVVAPKAFTHAMRGLIGHCTVITASHEGAKTGMVVTSGVSLTAEPPQVLFCINRGSSTWPVLRSSGTFGWSSLGAAHENVARRFAGFGGIKGADRFTGASWIETPGGVLLLEDAPLALACEVVEMVECDSHDIVIGRVTQVRSEPGAGALSYHEGAFHPMHKPA